MKSVISVMIAGLFAAVVAEARQVEEQEKAEATVRFEPVDVYIDPGDWPLAAYQFELIDPTGRTKIVGIEGGEHAAFSEPPYYDPAALMNNRVIIAAFSTDDELPSGRTRVATVHMQVSGVEKVDYQLNLQVAASVQGDEIDAQATLEYSNQETAPRP